LSFELVALNLPDRMGLHSLCLAKERKKTFYCQGEVNISAPWGLPVAFNLPRPSDAHPPPVVRPVTPDPQFAGPAGKACPR
jgi:hypothetical protein